MSQPGPSRQRSLNYIAAHERQWVRAVAHGMATLLLCQAALLARPAYAQLRPSASAAAGQRAIMDAAPNGVPIAHIAPPSAGGVSRNQYEQFNVASQGLILNNSAAAVQTGQGGWISGNLQLGLQPARIILTEVVGANPSQLRGTIEVAGQRADIVVANPNGIRCDGCGFLNTGRASLTTGQPQFNHGGGITGFDVRQGQLTIGGNGLNAGSLEQLDLIARGVVIEGEVWATRLNVIAGANQVLYGTLQAAAQTGAGPAPRFAIDIKDLGGMYANQVYLVSSELGVGVNSTGRMAALQGNLVLSASGELSLKDSYAAQNIQLSSAGNASLAGHTQSDGATTISAAGMLSNAGAIDAAGRLDLNAAAIANTGSIAQHSRAGATLNAGGQFSNSGSVYSAGSLSINGAAIADSGGSLQSADALRLQAGSVALSGTRLSSGAGVVIAASGGSLTASNTQLRANGNLDASAAAGLDVSGSDWQATGNVALRGAAVASRSGTVLANGSLSVDSGGVIANTDGRLLAGDRLALTGHSLSNAGGQVASDANVRVQVAAGVDNQGGVLSAGGSLVIASESGAVDNTGGTLVAGDSLAIDSGRLVNDSGAVVARARQRGALAITAAALSNRRGSMEAGAAARIESTSLDNAGGRIVARDTLDVATGTLANDNAGLIASSSAAVTVSAGRASNIGGLINGATAVTVNTQAFDNSGGELSAGGALALDTHGQALTNRGGAIVGSGNTKLRAGAIDSSGQGGAARISAGGTLDIEGSSLRNDGSIVSATQDATIRLGKGILSSKGGVIEAGSTLTIGAGALTSQSGSMSARDTATIRASSIDLTDGQVTAGNALAMSSAGALDNTRGSIVSNGRAVLAASSLDNTGGTVSAVQGTDIRLGAGLLDNTSGRLLGGQTLTVQSGEIRNAAGAISTASALTLDTGERALDNSNGGQIVTGGTLTLRSGSFVNKGGTAAAINGDLDVETKGQVLDNDGGRLQAHGNVTLATGALSNRGGLVSGQRVVIDNSTLNNDGGVVVANGELNITSQALAGQVLSNDRGLFQAGGKLRIATNGQALVNTNSGKTGGMVAGGALDVRAGKLDNRAGFIGSQGKQELTIAGDLDNRALNGQAGQIASNADSTIVAARLLNLGSRIDALGNAGITAGLIDNGAGAIAANGHVQLDVATLDNRAQSGMAGTIDAASITATATTIDNRGGAVRGAGDVTLTAALVDNRGGNLGAGGALAVTSTAVANAGGRIVGNGGVTITTSSQTPGGTIASQNNVTLNIHGDYSNTGLLSAQKNLTVNATNIDNSGTITAGETLTANTGNLANAGEISGRTVRLNAKGTLTNMLTGLIDGADTRIDTATLANAGRIYGDWLRINADTLNNSGTGVIAARNTLLMGVKNLSNTNGGLIYSLRELGVGGSVDPTGLLQGTALSLSNASSRIEAAGRMAIHADSILNRNDGLVTRMVAGAPVYEEYVQPRGSPARYPVAQCWGIGGGQDDNLCTVHPDKYNKRTTIDPVYSYVDHFDRETLETTTYTVVNYAWNSPVFARYNVTSVSAPQPAEPASGCFIADARTNATVVRDTPQCKQWSSDVATWNAAFEVSLTELDGKVSAYNAAVNEDNRVDRFQDYTRYKLDSITSRTEVVGTAPAQILSGGSMVLAGSVTNRDSQIVAGGIMTVVGPAVYNIATQGETRTEYSGTSEFSEVVAAGLFGNRHKRKWYDIVPYNPAPVSVMTDLPTVRFETLAGNQTSVRDLAVAANSANTTVADGAQAASRARDGAGGPILKAVLSTGPNAHIGQTATPVVQRVAAIGAGAHANDVILTTPPALNVPNNSLFMLHAEPSARTLVETDPRFTSYRSFISSDYFLQTLKRDPERQLKRYGDGFLEQQLVNDQILALTGRRYTDGYASTEEEFKALMDAGVAYALQYQLTPGVSLTAEQMALLTTDIVWLETRTVTLANGSTQQVIAPQVYLRRPQGGDLQTNGALIAGSDVQVQTTGDLVNSGAIAGRSVTIESGGDLLNQAGRVSGQELWMRASNDLKNLSGVITATGPGAKLTLLAGRDILLQTQTRDTINSDASSSRSSTQRIATVQGGDIRVDAGRDLQIEGAVVAADGSLVATAGHDIRVVTVAGQYQLDARDHSGRSTEGRSAYIGEAATINQASALLAGANLALHAGNDVVVRGSTINAAAGNALIEGSNVRIEAAKDRIATDVQTIGKNSYNRTARDNEMLVTGSVTAANNVTVRAAGNVTLTGAVVSAQGGQATLEAGNDITIANASTRHSAIDESHSKSGDLLTTTTTTRSSERHLSQAEGSVVSGNVVVVQAAHDLTVQGSAVVGEGDVMLGGVNQVSIQAASSTSRRKDDSQVVEQGFLDSDAVVSYGKRTTTTTLNEKGSTQSGQERSLVGASKGNLTITAGQALNVAGSDLGAGQDIRLQGKRINVEPGRDTSDSKFTSRMAQDALSLSVGGTVVNAVQAMEAMGEAAGKTKNARVQALAAATAALAAANVARDIAANGVNVTISLTAGHSESEQTDTHSTSTTAASRIAAGRDLSMSATGGGKDSSINVVGSDLSAKNNVMLAADNQVNLQSAQDLEEQHSTRKSMSASAGVGVSVGTKGTAFGVTASVSASRGQEDGSGVTQRNTRVDAGNTVTLVSGGDANIKGAVVSGKKVNADVGGNLNVESRQDTARFDNKNQSVSVSGTAGWGVSVSGSYSQSSISNDYASVQTQSGIQAGDGGFDVKVRGNTDLKGGVISSTQAAIDAKRNRLATATLTQSDVQNHADYRGESFGVSGGVASGGGDGKDPNATGAGKGPGGRDLMNVASTSGAGVGMPVAVSTSDSKDSVTKSGVGAGSIVITDAAGQQAATGKSPDETIASLNRNVGTGRDTSGRIANDFDKEDIKAQLAITTAFVQQAAPIAARVVGDFSKGQQDKAQREATAYEQAADAARKDGDGNKAADFDDKARRAQVSADNWGDNGIYRLSLHAASQAAVGGAAGGGSGAASAGAGVIGGNLGQQAGQKMGEAQADKLGLEGQARKDLVNSYQQVLATAGGALGGMVGGTAAGNGGGTGALASGVQGGNAGYSVDVFNRQLHPTEAQWIKDNAKRYAKQQGISEQEAEKRLAQQSQKQLQFGVEATEDGQARAFLSQAKGMLPADPNCPTCGPGYMFYATPDQKANISMYATQVVSDPKALEFYGRNGLTQPTPKQIQASASKDADIRSTVANATLGAAGVAVATAVPPALTWCLSNPVACNRAVIAGGEIAAGDALGPAGLGVLGTASAVKAVRSADEVNAAMKARGWEPPWSPGTPVIETTLQPGTKVNMIVDAKTAQAIAERRMDEVVPGGWATFDDVKSVATDMRQRTAITNQFKPSTDGPFYVVEMEITQSVKSNVGFVGKQTETTGGLLRGGGTQVQFDEAIKGKDRQTFLKPVSAPKLLN